jgi:hypothetical protein
MRIKGTQNDKKLRGKKLYNEPSFGLLHNTLHSNDPIKARDDDAAEEAAACDERL